MMFLANYFGTFFSYVYKVFAESRKVSDSLMTWASAIGALSNGFSRLFFGYLTDKISFRAVFLIYMSF
jgi:MFS family permease